MFKRHFGNCKCCDRPGLIVVKSGLRHQCNEEKKKREKQNRVVKLVNKAEEKKSLPYLKKELDDIFSLFIRQRHADKHGIVVCFTCGKRDHWKNMHCGHYVSRRFITLRYHIWNCQVQCPGCNLYNQGAADEFAVHLKQVYGDSVLNILNVQKHNKSNLGRFELELLIKEYKEQVRRIELKQQENEKNISG